MSFHLQEIGSVLSQIERPETPQAGKAYRQLGVRWWGEGAYERDPVDGGLTRYKTLWQVCLDDIVINKIWARHGSVAVVNHQVDGCYGGNEFPTFRPDPDRLHPRWFHWLTKARWFWRECAAHSKGTSGKDRITVDGFLSIRIPLPSIAEQRRLAAIIDGCFDRLAAVQKLRTTIENDFRFLSRTLLTGGDSKLIEVSKLFSLREPDVTVMASETYCFAGVFSFGRGVFKGNVKAGHEFSYKRLTRLRENDFVYPKLMAWEGAFGVVPVQCDGCVVSPEFPVFTIDTNKVLPEVVDAHFRNKAVWEDIAGLSTGTNVRRRRLHPSTFLRFKIPLPEMTAQQIIKNIVQRQRRLEAIYKESRCYEDAMIPSLLEKAIRGELS